jgi:hypothetical protein
VGADRERFGFAVLVFAFGKILFPGLTLADKKHGGFGTGPASVDGAHLFARRAESFAVRFLGTFHQPTRRDEILHPGKTANVVNLLENDQGQHLSDAWHGLEPRKGLHVLRLGPAREVEFHFAESLSIVITEPHVDLDGLVDTGIREMVGDIFAIRFGRQPFANFREIVLTIGIMHVGSEVGPFAGERTAAPQYISRRPHLCRIDVRLGHPPTPQ